MTFLDYVARDILGKYGTNLSRVAVVFPNKRASIFLNAALAKLSGKPLWSPAYITISELFRRYSPLQVADPIKLVCDLHKVFCQCTGSTESFDQFYGWGQLLLSDFDDIDKHLADADKVFFNLSAYHEMDDASFLDDTQKEVLKRFFADFDDDHATKLKKKFLTLWNHIGDIYHKFNERLAAQGLAYEGQLYRRVVEEGSLEFPYDAYLFVGFNMMQETELRLADMLKAQDKAFFYWDFDRYYTNMRKVGQLSYVPEAGVFVNQYRRKYRNELDESDGNLYDNFSRLTHITFGAAPTENVQARYVTQWLLENDRYKDGRATAIVLADERLLQTVIHSLPPEVSKVNVTTGYPLSLAPVTTLVAQLVQLQTVGSSHGDFFRRRYVRKVLQHVYAPLFSEQMLERLEKDDAESIVAWLISVLQEIGYACRSRDDEADGADVVAVDMAADPFFQESLFRMYALLNRLHNLMLSGDLDISPLTLQRLITQLVDSTTIPFNGKPAEGVQIMGVLETRNLDFDHVLLLSCNEGNMPKGINDSSFIPYSIRKAFGLTTADNKVAIYSYYFHSLLQRAHDVTLLYNNGTEDGKTGEMSRFMLQLLVDRKGEVRQLRLQTGQTAAPAAPLAIKKEGHVLDVLNCLDVLTPTAINNYIRCQLRFYYRFIARVAEPDNADKGEIDNAVFGDIFHRAAQLLYEPFDKGGIVSRDNIDRMLKHGEIIAAAVDQAFKEVFFKSTSARFKPEYNGLQTINRNVIIAYIRQLLTIDRRLAPFTILHLEHWVGTKLKVETTAGAHVISTGGYIDRLDQVSDGNGQRIRVIDYKTGAHAVNTITSIEEIFTGEHLKQHHTDYFLQTLLYSLLVRHDGNTNPAGLPVSPALLYIQHAGGESYEPTLLYNKRPLVDCETVAEEYTAGLRSVIHDIFEPTIDFEPTTDRTRCDTCPYAQLCYK